MKRQIPIISSTVLLLSLMLLASPVWGQVGDTGKYVSINDMEMYYEVHGQGEPLVLLHGFLASGRLWDPVVEKLASSYQIIVPDMRGHGKSTNPSKEFTHRQSAHDIYALLDHLGIERFKALGISSGGMTLLHMATQQDDRLESMVLIGSTIYFPEQARAIMEQTSYDKRDGPTWSWVEQFQSRGDEQVQMLFDQFHGFKDSFDDMNFTAPLLSTITAQTLIVHGDRDAFFPLDIPVLMNSSIPNSYLWIVPNGGHAPIFDSMLPHFLETTTKFLQEEWGVPFMSGE